MKVQTMREGMAGVANLYWQLRFRQSGDIINVVELNLSRDTDTYLRTCKNTMMFILLTMYPLISITMHYIHKLREIYQPKGKERKRWLYPFRTHLNLLLQPIGRLGMIKKLLQQTDVSLNISFLTFGILIINPMTFLKACFFTVGITQNGNYSMSF